MMRFSVVMFLTFLVTVSCNWFETKPRRSDQLFLGMYLGMKKEEFFDRCWVLNKENKVTQGPGNQSVEYRLNGNSKPAILMHFYPNFYKDRIFEMPVVYNYEAWAPWNRQYWSDALIDKIVHHFDTTYGKMEVLDHRTMGKVYYRVDGKRRINVFIKDEQFVQAVFTDLSIERKIKRMNSEGSYDE